ncbi:iron-containing alcohol dehydrogenase family protein [Haloimpatiens sp. FM7330]|uniref:iron-containing alcohol dehydrogenase family protein n=1 Tax=Haloimpatiens sp. FM7330 TaxID=3298610 RepID=UPI003629B704
MNDFQYLMSTKVLYGKDIIIKEAELFKKFGKKAFIVTGKSSSKKNGSLNDVVNALKKNNIEYCIFDNVEENPSLEMIDEAAQIGREENVDFIIGIGGGSPLDSSKGIGVLLKNKNANVEDLYNEPKLDSIPIIAVPTTAGTGSEVTPYAIFTNHKIKTKKNFMHRVFPKIAFLDAKYLMHTPYNVTVNTCVDALSHLVEGYLSSKANILSDAAAEKGMRLFGECIPYIKENNFTYEVRKKLLLISTLAGMVIAQSGTSLPHGMGYPLTYFHGIPHGKANGLLLKAYLEFCEDKKKVESILECIRMNNTDELGELLNEILGKENFVSEDEINEYTNSMINNKGKLKNHPYKVNREDIFKIYKESLM